MYERAPLIGQSIAHSANKALSGQVFVGKVYDHLERVRALHGDEAAARRKEKLKSWGLSSLAIEVNSNTCALVGIDNEQSVRPYLGLQVAFTYSAVPDGRTTVPFNRVETVNLAPTTSQTAPH